MSDNLVPARASSSRRVEVLRLLQAAAAPLSIAAIAKELAVHPNTVRFHLDTLVGDAQVKRVQPDRRAPGRPPLMFAAIKQMDRGGPRRYRLLAEILATGFAGELDPGAKALAAGRAWGRQATASTTNTGGAEESVDRLVELLDELGFEPERPDTNDNTRIGLRHCPFLELAETQTSVVCPIHLGLMQGALESWQAPVSVERLDPFLKPDLCLAHLSMQDTTVTGHHR
jgi:predicted ArsR family transcriptional regulator